MSEGEAFVNPMAANPVQSGRGHPEAHQAERNRCRRGGAIIRPVVESLAAVVAGAIVVLTILHGTGAIGRDTGAPTLTSGTMGTGPHSRSLGRELADQTGRP